MTGNKKFILISSILCIIACIADLLLLFVFADHYPGYRQLYDPISALGADNSPVAIYASIWWVILGLNFIVFAFGFRKAFMHSESHINTAFWLIILYALGEGIGSGLFPGNHVNNHLTIIGIFHNILGGIGVISLFALPFVLLKVFTWEKTPLVFYMSWLISISGIFLFLLFSVSRFIKPYTGLLSMHGFWQRVYIADYYIYFILLSLLAIKSGKTLSR